MRSWFVFFMFSMLLVLFCFFFFKQKTAYEMRISDWSSDVCSSDLWELAGLDRPRALRSTLTLGADSPEAMAKAALAIDAEAPIKVKLTGDLDEAILRVAAIPAARPDAGIGVDSNPGYDRPPLARLLPLLFEHRSSQLAPTPN